jgi:hypothetical protein
MKNRNPDARNLAEKCVERSVYLWLELIWENQGQEWTGQGRKAIRAGRTLHRDF